MNTDKPAKALLIDPQNRTITEVEWDGSNEHIYALIDATCFDVCRTDPNNMLFVDDEGLINGKAGNVGMFAWEGKRGTAFLAGKALLLGTIGEHTVSTTWDVGTAANAVDWGYPVRIAGKVVFNGQKKMHSMEGY